MARIEGEPAAELDVQVVTQEGQEPWVSRDEAPAVIARGEAIGVTGLKMWRQRGTALEMTPVEVAAIETATEEYRQSLESAA